MGAIFCQVKRIRDIIQSNPLITSGNQKWSGAAPIFSRRATWRIKDVTRFKFSEKFFLLVKIIRDKIKIIEAIVWVRKYLIAASEE